MKTLKTIFALLSIAVFTVLCRVILLSTDGLAERRRHFQQTFLQTIMQGI